MRPFPRAARPLRHCAVCALQGGVALVLAGAMPATGAADAPAQPEMAVPAAIGEGSQPPAGGGTADIPSPDELEQMRAAIGSVAIDIDEIFDEDDPRENKLLFRLANDLHLATREATVRDQLLFHPGEKFSAQKAEETARLLRASHYLAEADVAPTRYDPATNTVDVKVRVRDVWTLEPGIGFGRSGGANKTRVRVADENLLGLGQEIALEYKSNEDRSGVGLQFHDPHLFHSWWAFDTQYADTSDGSIGSLSIGQPFFSLDSHWSAGVSLQAIDQVTSLYDLGEPIDQFDSKYDTVAVQGGISAGLVNGWARRWLAGYRYDRARFAASQDTDIASIAVPEDRLLSYPWVGLEFVQDSFRTTRNQDQIGRTEDVFVGKKLRASLGWAAPAFGADRSAGIYSFTGEMGLPIGADDTLLLASSLYGRLEGGSTTDSVLEAEAHYYHRFSDRNLFVASFDGAHGQDLDLDHQIQLGGDNGLRGYPLRYQTGNTRALATIEERYFTDWYPFRLVHVGGAVFADVGRTWGDAPLASESQGWLGDVGFGLRLGNARSGLGNMLHIDLAFPLAGSQDIDSMQLLLQAKHSF